MDIATVRVSSFFRLIFLYFKRTAEEMQSGMTRSIISGGVIWRRFIESSGVKIGKFKSVAELKLFHVVRPRNFSGSSKRGDTTLTNKIKFVQRSLGRLR